MTLTISSVLYVIAVYAVYILTRRRLRPYMLCLAGLVYLYFVTQYALIAVLFIAAFTWCGGLLIHLLLTHHRNTCAKILTGILVGTILAILLTLKFFPLMLTRVEGYPEILTRVVIPLGYSFYAFQAISYLADLYRNKQGVQKNPLKLLFYLCYFPKFGSGPLMRAGDFFAQSETLFEVDLFNKTRLLDAANYMVTGFFMKVVIADRLGLVVDPLFASPTSYGSLSLILGIACYSIQLYCDFAGYSYAAIGISMIFGIRLPLNFATPYLSQNITEFWRRWHMTLGQFLRDYLYIPLGGNRHGTGRKMCNLLLVFLACGIWHGAGWQFAVWGVLHGLYSVLDSALQKHGYNRLRTGMTGRLLTLLAVAFSWVFFRSESLPSALQYLACVVRNFGLTAAEPLLAPFDLWLIVILIVLLILAEVMSYRKDCSIPDLIMQRPFVLKCIIYSLMLHVILLFGVYGPDLEGGRPIYMQF